MYDLAEQESIAPVGVIHGRFQPVHLGHMEYLLAGKRRCRFLFIGITNPDPMLTAREPTNPARSLPLANPLTFYERLIMLREAMLEARVPRKEFDIVPFPINYPNHLKSYVPKDALYFLTIYDDWGRTKLKLLQSLGLETEVMWERGMTERLTSGTEVRQLIVSDGDWQHLVPRSVAKLVEDFRLGQRIRALQNV